MWYITAASSSWESVAHLAAFGGSTQVPIVGSFSQAPERVKSAGSVWE